MIVDSDGRYVLAAAATQLVRYDCRWRRSQREFPFDGENFVAEDGNGHVLCLRVDGSRIDASVRSASAPGVAIATGEYDGKWRFSGGNHGWTYVPEYILVNLDGSSSSSSSLLRVADDGEADGLEGIEPMHAVVPLPGSRLVVLAGSGEINVYDPISRVVNAHFVLAGGAQQPRLRVANNGESIWLDDNDTLIKLDTRSWEVVDAAGYETPEATLASWALSQNERWAAVVRSEDSDVLLLNASTMLPVARCAFLEPVDQVAVLDDGSLVGFRSATATFFRPRRQTLIGS